jgi:hypothetical protein
LKKKGNFEKTNLKKKTKKKREKVSKKKKWGKNHCELLL